MNWASFSVRGLSSFAFVSGKLNGEKYTDILQNDSLSFVNEHHGDRCV